MSESDFVRFRAQHTHIAQWPLELSYTQGDSLLLRIQKGFTFQQLQQTYKWVEVQNQSTGCSGYVQVADMEQEGPVAAAVTTTTTPASTVDNRQRLADLDNMYVKCRGVVESTTSTATTPATTSTNNRHNLINVFFLTPILCIHCSDYIWGNGRQGVACTDCHSSFHLPCKKFSQLYGCSSKQSPLTDCYQSDTPLVCWTNVNILEWMAAVNLYAFVEIFKAINIKGNDLALLDDEKLLNLGVKNPQHRIAIASCVKELLAGVLISQQPQRELVDSCNLDENLLSYRNHNHKFIECSFDILTNCYKCCRSLRGVVNQGLQCTGCAYIVHRTCLFNGLTVMCNGGTQTTTVESVYDMSLRQQFEPKQFPAPLPLVFATKALEMKVKRKPSIDLYKLYKSTSIPDFCSAKIKNILRVGENILETFLDIDESQLVGFIKKFLRELNDPLIPVQWYDSIIAAAKLSPDEQSIDCLRRHVHDLPEQHRNTLIFFIDHMRRIAQMQYLSGKREPPTILIQSMCHIVLRPPWPKIVQLIGNTEYHIKIVEFLFYHGESHESVPQFDVAPAIPPRKISRGMSCFLNTSKLPPPPIITAAAVQSLTPSSGSMTSLQSTTTTSSSSSSTTSTFNSSTNAIKSNSDQLIDAEWYWGAITREEVKEILSGQPDGSFLVRNASSQNGEYTLTVIKDGTEKLIKIFCKNDKYGFVDDSFNSVVELIDYYKEHSLCQYNNTLDIMLSNPIIRRVEDEESSIQLNSEQLKALIEEYLQLDNTLAVNKQTLQLKKEQYESVENELNLKKLAHEAFNKAIKLFNDQIELHIKMRQETPQIELGKMDKNREYLNCRLEDLKKNRMHLNDYLEKKKESYKVIEREINDVKPVVSSLSRKKEKMQNRLIQCGFQDDQLKQLLEFGYDAWKLKNEIDIGLPHYEQSTWFLQNANRHTAEQMLAGKPSGTFLIRPRADTPDQYALSIACNKTVNHCIIYQTDQGFGFAEPYFIYPNLKNLVLHYATNSLEVHNEELETTLKYPVNQVKQQPQTTTAAATSVVIPEV